MGKIRVLIADDHGLVRAGFHALLAGQAGLEVVGEAEDGVVVVEKCRQLAPHVVLLDWTMPGRGGLGALQDLRRTCPDVKVLMVSVHDDETYARQALLAGAAGYVPKKSVGTALIAAIRAVQNGQQYFASSVAKTAAHTSGAAGAPCLDRDPLGLLTAREREVVREVALGYTNAEVADRLHLSEKTVETHRKHIVTKLGLRSRADLVRLALAHGLIGA